MSTLTLLLFVVGGVLLIVGAELLVRGASRLAGALGIPPLIIGLTVVAFGTSSPEAAVSVGSALGGQADIALGNVVGSNIFNILFILGLSALVIPLAVSGKLIRLDVPLMIVASVAVLALALDGDIGRLDGLLLFAGIVVYTYYLVRAGRRESRESTEEYEREYSGTGRVPLQLTLIVVGLVMLVAGSRWLVNGAVEIASALGVSELIVGLTIVAAGTSLPEVATSVLAALRGEREIAVGNVVGSCIFNLLLVLGLTGIVAPSGIGVPASALGFDIPVMIAASAACLPIFFTGHRINRWEGLLFLGYYGAYTLYLLLNATSHDALPAFNLVMLGFVIPLTAITLAVVASRSLHRRLRKRT